MAKTPKCQFCRRRDGTHTDRCMREKKCVAAGRAAEAELAAIRKALEDERGE